ncbi:CD225/dispanin family protein [Pedobacter sp. SYP-B3415]|uniref:CD225/dispanin family protein n=1 Tax=Pedobacter sp. SYP-B3415 TaxID=2496641 RepID=UPI00101CE6C5|nr:CD225/dispanin family protein [Pedobacter sp. SYP-B3415]
MEENQPFGQPPGQQPPFGQSNFNNPLTPRPKNYLVESILVTILCCLPLGIAGIVNAANVNSRYDAGDYAGAQAASKDAWKYTKLGFIIGLVVGILYFVVVVILGVGGAMLGR